MVGNPINVDILKFDFVKFMQGNNFDVVLIDPPWKMPTCPTRGVCFHFFSK